MERGRTQNLFALAIVALATFIAGFALAWQLKPQTVQVVEVPAATQAQTPEPSKPAGEADSLGEVAANDPEDASLPIVLINGNTATDTVYGVTVENGASYSSKYEVALYIHAFGDVPPNYITKTKARASGWVASEGNLWDVLPGMSIGGGGFNNIEGELPLDYDPDRTFKECDINYSGGYRGAERLVWSDDGYIFYTADHYESFELLYPHEEG